MSGLISRALQYEGDPAVWAMDIQERVAPYLPSLKIGGPDLLIGVWVPNKEQKLKSGLYMPEKTKDEYQFQGVTGLILKIGPLAYGTEKTRQWFVDDDGNPDPPRVGEWVSFNFKQGEPFLLVDQPCRIIADQYVMTRMSRPDLIA